MRLAAGPGRTDVMEKLFKLAEKSRGISPGMLYYEIDHIIPKRPRPGYTGGPWTSPDNLGFLLGYDNRPKSSRPWPGSTPGLERFRQGHPPFSLESVLRSTDGKLKRRLIGEMLGTRAFSEIIELDLLWRQANAGTAGSRTYEATRQVFMELIGGSDLKEAQLVRDALKFAGVRLERSFPILGSFRMALPAATYLGQRVATRVAGYVMLGALTRALGLVFMVFEIANTYMAIIALAEDLIERITKLSVIEGLVDQKVRTWTTRAFPDLRHVEHTNVFINHKTGEVHYLDVSVNDPAALAYIGSLTKAERRSNAFEDWDANIRIDRVNERWRIGPIYGEPGDESQSNFLFLG
ncbi:MAG: hypothetical protein BroJett030_20580 [Alphaproteobacteria bacterium]|nr:MAG: hypothetical protein BroJett030_20580 [Alphaproteobacteria bacterium]